MGFNRYSEKGRTLIVEFKCQRCGAIELEPLEEVVKNSHEHYDCLHNLRTPKDWSDNFYGRLLCPECTQKLKEFFEMKDGGGSGKT